MRPVHRSKLVALASAMCIAAAGSLVVEPLIAQTTVSGVGYAQYAYQASDTVGHVNNFDVARAYVTVTGRFAGGVATRVTSDIYRVADGSLALRLKYAHVMYTPEGSPLTFKFGQIQTPWVDHVETLWDYRMQGTVALDRNGYLSSSDFGMGVDGRWGGDRLNLSAGIYNGESYSKAPGDQRKDVMARVSYRLASSDDASRVGGLRLSGYAHYGKPTTGGERQRFAGMLSYRSSRYTLAAEFATTTDSVTGAGAITPVAERSGQVVSVFGVLRLPRSRWAAIGRVDLVDPNTDAGADQATRVIAGVSYQLSPNLRVLGDVESTSYESGRVLTAAEHAARTLALFQLQFTF